MEGTKRGLPAQRHGSSPSLSDLDDAVLVNIFGRLDPLPHLFSICRVCKRFRKLGGDGRLYLRVNGLGRTRTGAAGHRLLSFATLNEAVLASRPGDTIMLEPGLEHPVQDVEVEWPLRVMGAGKTAEETVLTSLLGANSAVTFRASGILANLTVNSDQAACVTHHRGTVVVDSCLLHSTPASGLEHLFTPLVTLAASPPRRLTDQPLEGPPGSGSEAGQRVFKLQPHSGGVLSVKETKIRGRDGMRAVKAAGTGAVAGVRAIRLSADTLFWFEVDSGQAGLRLVHPELPAAAAVAAGVQDQQSLPAWARAGRPLFQPGREPAMSLAQTVIKQEDRGNNVANMQLKSKAWSLAGERSVKPRYL